MLHWKVKLAHLAVIAKPLDSIDRASVALDLARLERTAGKALTDRAQNGVEGLPAVDMIVTAELAISRPNTKKKRVAIAVVLPVAPTAVAMIRAWVPVSAPMP